MHVTHPPSFSSLLNRERNKNRMVRPCKRGCTPLCYSTTLIRHHHSRSAPPLLGAFSGSAFRGKLFLSTLPMTLRIRGDRARAHRTRLRSQGSTAEQEQRAHVMEHGWGTVLGVFRKFPHRVQLIERSLASSSNGETMIRHQPWCFMS